MRPKHIYWFAYYGLNSPSVRYRGQYPLEYMEKYYGITHSFIFPQDGLTRKIKFLRMYLDVLLSRKKDSVIVYQKIYTDRLYAKALKLLLLWHPENTVYDIDDAEHLRVPEKSIRYFISRCSMCTVGSSYLKEYAKQYNPRVKMISSPVIAHGYQKKEKGTVFTVGWVGEYGGNDPSVDEYSHRNSLMQLVFPGLKDLPFKIRLVLMGVTSEDDKREVERLFAAEKNIELDIPLHINWKDEDTVYRRIMEFDVGLAAMLENDFNKAKSAFKLKQYFSCAVPVLATEVGENKRFLRHGENGFLCANPCDFRKGTEYFRNLDKDGYSVYSAKAFGAVRQFDMETYTRGFLFCFQEKTLNRGTGNA